MHFQRDICFPIFVEETKGSIVEKRKSWLPALVRDDIFRYYQTQQAIIGVNFLQLFYIYLLYTCTTGDM